MAAADDRSARGRDRGPAGPTGEPKRKRRWIDPAHKAPVRGREADGVRVRRSGRAPEGVASAARRGRSPAGATDHASHEPAVVPRPAPVVPDDPGAARIVVASWVGTALLALTAVPAAIAPDVFVPAAVLVSLLLFAAGILTFLWAYAVAVARSRTDLMGIGGLFFLAGSAPARVQRSLMASFLAQILLAVVTASVRIFTPVAFTVLAPMYGLGLMGLWGARYGTFPPRPPDPVGPGRSRSGDGPSR